MGEDAYLVDVFLGVRDEDSVVERLVGLEDLVSHEDVGSLA